MTANTRDIAIALRNEVLPDDAKRYGVVIGIDRYRDERLNLRCACADAEAIRNLMIDPECGLFEEDQVTLLLDDAATREQIWRALAGLRRKTHAHDSVWIFYAGHGAPEGDDFYWVPHDGDVDDLYSTGLSRRDLNRVLGDIHAERIVAFMDCCHAAAMGCQKNKTREVITAEKALAAYQGKGRLIFAASDGQEKSVEIADQGRGAFSFFLEQGLRGEADAARSGVVTADGLWLYLKDKVTTAAQAAGNPQSPVRIGEETHDFALSLNPLEFGRRKRIAAAITHMVGVGPEQLSTEEGRICLDLLRRSSRNDADRDLCLELDVLADGPVRTSTIRRLAAAVREAKCTTTEENDAEASPSDLSKSGHISPHDSARNCSATDCTESDGRKTADPSSGNRFLKGFLVTVGLLGAVVFIVTVVGTVVAFLVIGTNKAKGRREAKEHVATIASVEGHLQLSGNDFRKLESQGGRDFMRHRLVEVKGVAAGVLEDGSVEFFSSDGRMKYVLEIDNGLEGDAKELLKSGKPVSVRAAVHRYHAGFPILRVTSVLQARTAERTEHVGGI